jgi:hypothetical protein
MDMGDLTPLAEAGIAVNLAYSVLVGLNKALGGRLSQRIADLRTRCAYQAELAFHYPLALIGHLDRLSAGHRRVSTYVEYTGVAFALTIAAVLVLFLTCAAKRNQTLLDEIWADRILCLAGGPMLIAVGFQILVFGGVWLYLRVVTRVVRCAVDELDPQATTVTGP